MSPANKEHNRDRSLMNIKEYTRLTYWGTAFYLHPSLPDWFIPTPETDRKIQELTSEKNIAGKEHEIPANTFDLQRLNIRLKSNQKTYHGRSHYRSLTRLKECWFHITNRCNMRCSHCMFANGPEHDTHIPPEKLYNAITEVIALGCDILYFTGGEPFTYPEFPKVCDFILNTTQAHIVILTNAKNITTHTSWLKKLSRERVHFQVSLDGSRESHEALRGKGSYNHLLEALHFLRRMNFAVTITMSVAQHNVKEMRSILEVARQYDIHNVHYMWLFKKGNASDSSIASPAVIAEELLQVYESAQRWNILIDNIEILKSQLFSLPGTKYDLSNAGWESIAVAPDGIIYPSPALIGTTELRAGSIDDGIEKVWKEGNVLKKIRSLSCGNHPAHANDPFTFLIGGGDIDHSYAASQQFIGHDPYFEVYKTIVCHLLFQETHAYGAHAEFGLVSRMGEKITDCGEESSQVNFTHSNCVLSLPGTDGHRLARTFYNKAARKVNHEIINPVRHDAKISGSHIPEESMVRSYGCGSPVSECGLQKGNSIVDLGSGTGVECFMAAKLVGPEGKVYGIDMSDDMLAIAEASREKVIESLGYDNLIFKKGLLEHVPLESASVDVVISNCVINLSPDKRKTFHEIFRILKPGGRVCISDIVADTEIPLAIKYNEKLRGECIGGAMREHDLYGLLEDIGFLGLFIKKRFPYRTVKGFMFHSVTYEAQKPSLYRDRTTILYRGPFAGIISHENHILPRGIPQDISLPEDFEPDASIMLLDKEGNVTNMEQENNCGCFTAQAPASEDSSHRQGCLVCGSEIIYLDKPEKARCAHCDTIFEIEAKCSQGHFICDTCHTGDSPLIIEQLALHPHTDDMITLLEKMRNHPSVSLHGPQHHFIVPAIILACYREKGGDIPSTYIHTAITRGNAVPGGACAFFGVCGAAIGVGIAYSLICNATPYRGAERQKAQQLTAEILQKIAGYKAPRCCQRDCWIALTTFSDLSKEYIGMTLPADGLLKCSQYRENKECIHSSCPLWPYHS